MCIRDSNNIIKRFTVKRSLNVLNENTTRIIIHGIYKCQMCIRDRTNAEAVADIGAGTGIFTSALQIGRAHV